MQTFPLNLDTMIFTGEIMSSVGFATMDIAFSDREQQFLEKLDKEINKKDNFMKDSSAEYDPTVYYTFYMGKGIRKNQGELFERMKNAWQEMTTFLLWRKAGIMPLYERLKKIDCGFPLVYAAIDDAWTLGLIRPHHFIKYRRYFKFYRRKSSKKKNKEYVESMAALSNAMTELANSSPEEMSAMLEEAKRYQISEREKNLSDWKTLSGEEKSYFLLYAKEKSDDEIAVEKGKPIEEVEKIRHEIYTKTHCQSRFDVGQFAERLGLIHCYIEALNGMDLSEGVDFE